MNKIAACVLVKHLVHDLYLGVSRKNKFSEFGLPGGKQDPGETLEETAIRELKEETGVILYSPMPVFEMVDHEGWHTTTFMGGVIMPSNFVTNEPIAVGWITKEQLIAGPFGVYNIELFKSLEGQAALTNKIVDEIIKEEAL